MKKSKKEKMKEEINGIHANRRQEKMEHGNRINKKRKCTKNWNYFGAAILSLVGPDQVLFSCGCACVQGPLTK
jgi:hypothetical protein